MAFLNDPLAPIQGSNIVPLGGTPSFATHQEALDYLTGKSQPPSLTKDLVTSSPSTSTPDPLGGGEAGGGGGATPQALPGAPPGAVIGQTGSLRERLLGGVSGAIPGIQGNIETARGQFYQGAEPSRTFSSIGAEGQLQQGIAKNAQTEDINRAKGLAGAHYGGPTGLDTTQTGSIQDAIQNLLTTGGALQGGSGLYGLVSLATPGITPGEARAEASSLRSDPGFIGETSALTPKVSDLQASLDNEKRLADIFARQRTQEESGIASQSQDWLKGQRGQLEGGINQRVGQANQEEQRIADAWSKFLTSQNPQDIMATNPEAAGFDTPLQAQEKQSQAAFDTVMGRHEPVKDVPLMQLQITNKGRETWVLPEDWIAANRGKYNDQEWNALLEEAKRRQEDFAVSGFDPGSAYAKGQAGQFSTFNPSFFDAAPIEAQNPAAYGSFDPGTEATMANLATEDERTKINHINDILGDSGPLAKDEEPFRQAKIALDLDKFMADEQAALEARKGALNDVDQEYLGALSKARKHYKQLKNRKGWGKVARIATSIGTLGMSEAPISKGLIPGGLQKTEVSAASSTWK